MLYKKWLFVPCKEKYLKMNELGADALIYDLEDSIREEEKARARERLIYHLQKENEHEHSKEIYIRINSGAEGIKDLVELKNSSFMGVIIPKVENIQSLHAFLPFIQGKQVIALIESIAGVLDVAEIAASPMISGIAFGGEDFCKELGVETNDLAMQYARGQIVLFARYFNKYCLDTISLEYKDLKAFLLQFKNSLAMGFHSKLLIHPAQVEAISELEKTIDVMELKEIIKQYNSSTEGLVQVYGRWYEKPHIERIRKMLEELEESI